MIELTEHRRLRDIAARAFDSCRWLDALKAIDPILSSGSACVEDWLFTGQVLIKVREYAQAAQVLQEGLRLQPDHLELQYELAISLFQLGNVPAASRILEELAQRSGMLPAWRSLATIIPGCPTANNAKVLKIRRQFVAQLLGSSNSPTSPTGTLDWERKQVGPAMAMRKSLPDRRIRLGYISAFFHRANYMKPVWGLINSHDRRRFDVELFADDCRTDQFDWFRPGLQDRIHITSQLNNNALGNLIRERQLDIAIDLNAYSVAPRLELYTQRLAPSVVAWFNLYATSALPGIDWIVGDQYVIRGDEDADYTERVFRLPYSYLSFVVGHQAPDVVPPPCLNNEYFTFGSLVSQYKITPTVLDAWSEILSRVQRSRLLIANRAMQSTMNREYLISEFAQRGVSDRQLILLPPADHFEYLRYYNQIDLALDAFPYNGGTTTTESIWQGVPVLTFDGDRWAARTSRTLLMNCHLKEFVSPDRQAWIEAAVRWATDENSPHRLTEIRSSMREQLLESDVCQMPLMVQAMEEFFQSIAG